MGKKCSKETVPFLTKIHPDKREEFSLYFKTAPDWLLDAVTVEEVKKGTTVFHEGERIDTIYFIGKGLAKVTDNNIHGMSYNHRLFTKMYAYGAMEVLMEVEEHCHTLQTLTDCLLVKVPENKFERWIHTDITALKQVSKLMGEYLFSQACSSRDFLFLQGANRLAWLFVDWHEKYAQNGILRISSVRQDLSDFTGICVRTVNRCLRKFINEGYISRKGSDIEINQKQYLLLKESTEEGFREAI